MFYLLKHTDIACPYFMCNIFKLSTKNVLSNSRSSALYIFHRKHPFQQNHRASSKTNAATAT